MNTALLVIVLVCSACQKESRHPVTDGSTYIYIWRGYPPYAPTGMLEKVVEKDGTIAYREVESK